MIFYTKNLTSTIHNELREVGLPADDPAAIQRQVGAAVQAPMVLTGIPFDQPDPQTSQTLRQMALHLEGISQVSFGR